MCLKVIFSLPIQILQGKNYCRKTSWLIIMKVILPLQIKIKVYNIQDYNWFQVCREEVVWLDCVPQGTKLQIYHTNCCDIFCQLYLSLHSKYTCSMEYFTFRKIYKLNQKLFFFLCILPNLCIVWCKNPLSILSFNLV